MSRPRFCKKCKRGDKGDGVWVKPFLWKHDNFLRQTVANIKKYGEIQKLEMCKVCISEIKEQGHIVRKDGKKL
jgi:hypothetical protein